MKRLITSLLIAFLFAVVSFAGSRTGKGKPKPPPITTGTISLRASDWYFAFGSGVPYQPAENIGQPGWWFNFPRFDGPESQCVDQNGYCPDVDYIITTVRWSLLSKSRLHIVLQIVPLSGNPVFLPSDKEGCDPPTYVRAIVSKDGDDLVSDFGRWWSNPIAVQINSNTGVATIDIPITPDQWSSVFGHRGSENASTLAGWMAAFSTPQYVGLTFGGTGGCFGHGVYVANGDARFVLLDYTAL